MADMHFNGAERIDIGNNQELDLYRAREVSITIIRANGQTITLRNFQDGDMVTTEKTNNKTEGMADAQGSPAAAVQYDHLGTITTTLVANSSSNEIMSELEKGDEVFGFIVTYGHEKSGGSHCLIQKTPPINYGKTVPTRAWPVQVYDYDYDGNHE